MKVSIRRAREKDYRDVHRFVSRCPPLECYPEHVYKILFRYQGDSCFIARTGDTIVGFVTLLACRDRRDTFFLWQIGVVPAVRGKGIGRRILREAVRRVRRKGCRRIEVTIEPENQPSLKLFRSMGYRNISGREKETVTRKGTLAVKNHYGPGSHFAVLEKRL